jgi:predicted AlkP superfamily pyrophosphatase or phosphodiesterase
VTPQLPEYGARGLLSVLPKIALSLGVPAWDQASEQLAGEAGFPPADRAVVVLLDGLGLELLRSRAGHAPFLRRLLQRSESPHSAGFPTTTATSIGSFGTGLPP